MLLLLLCSVMSDSLQPHGLQPARFLCPRNFPDKNSGVGAISFSMGSSWPKDRTCVPWVSCVGSWILYHCATGKPLVNFRCAARWHIHPFLHSFLLWFITGSGIQFPVPYRRTWSICAIDTCNVNSLPPLIPDFHSTPPQPLPLQSGSLFLFCN